MTEMTMVWAKARLIEDDDPARIEIAGHTLYVPRHHLDLLPQNPDAPPSRAAIQTLLEMTFKALGLDVTVGVTKNGVSIISQDERLDCRNVPHIVAHRDELDPLDTATVLGVSTPSEYRMRAAEIVSQELNGELTRDQANHLLCLMYMELQASVDSADEAAQ